MKNQRNKRIQIIKRKRKNGKHMKLMLLNSGNVMMWLAIKILGNCQKKFPLHSPNITFDTKQYLSVFSLSISSLSEISPPNKEVINNTSTRNEWFVINGIKQKSLPGCPWKCFLSYSNNTQTKCITSRWLNSSNLASTKQNSWKKA